MPTTNLKKVCPSTITLQIDWFPEAEYGVYFSLIGANGTLDTGKGRYTGPLGKTGVNLQIRAGGPFIGQQTVQSLMYQDPSITLGLVHTDDAIRFSKQLPVVSVVAPLLHSPLALLWDPAKHNFKTFRDIGSSGAKILVFTKAVNYVPYLIKKGIIPDSSFDDSFDGSYARFVADNSLVQQAFATETPYRLQYEIKAFGRPTAYLLVSQTGYDPYLSTVAVRKSQLSKLAPCLQKLVPIIQRAEINYLKNPVSANKVMVDVVTRMNTFWTLSLPGLKFGDDQMLKLKMVGNGVYTPKTFGDQSPNRIQKMITDFHDVFGDVSTADPSVSPSSIMTNKFIDPTVSLSS